MPRRVRQVTFLERTQISQHLVSRRGIAMIVYLDEHIDFGFRRETWNRGASNVVYRNQRLAKGRSDEYLVCQNAGS